MTSSQSLLQVPFRLDVMWSDGQTNLATQTARMENLQGSAERTQPWLGDTVNTGLMDTAPLPVGMHLHWTLPKGLRNAAQIFVLDTALFNELVRQGVPASLVQALQNLASEHGSEWSKQELQQALSNLSETTFTPLATSDFSLMDAAKDYSTVVTSDAGVSVETFIPDLSWDPVLVEIYAPLILQFAAQTRFYAVPNRWLILREASGGAQTAWVLESDKLTAPNPDGSAPVGVGPIAVPETMDDSQAMTYGISTPAEAFSFLGAATPSQDWAEDVTASRLVPLTVVGNGQPDFAAYYPNCQGVFGFCDTSADPAESYVYSVLGWYNDATQDPISPSFDQNPWAHETDVSVRAQSLGWALGGDDWQGIEGSIFATQISVSAASCATAPTTQISTKVAVGLSPGEALSAYIAQNTDDKDVYSLSPQTILNAAQSGILDELNGPDGPAKIENALHTQGFKTSFAGSQWTVSSISPDEAGLSGRTAPPTLLPASVASAVNALNDAQRDFDLANQRLTAERSLLFTDWCRTQHLGIGPLADPADPTDPYPNGSTTIAGADGTQFNVISAQVVQAQANAIDEAGFASNEMTALLCYNAMQALYIAHVSAVQALAAFDVAGDMRLLRIPAQTYMQPTDPVIMMVEGNGGPDLTLSPETTLPVNDADELVVSLAPTGGETPTYLPTTWDTNEGVPSDTTIAAVIDGLIPTAGQQSWRPVLLRWEAEVSPYPGSGKITSDQTANENNGTFSVNDYPSDFIQSSFSLDGRGIDYGFPALADDATRASIYQNRIALASNALTTVQQQILQFTGQADDPPSSADELALNGALDNDAIRALLWDAYSSDDTVLHQALSGFNAHLMMLNGAAQVSEFTNTLDVGGVTNVSLPAWDSDHQSFYPQVGLQRRSAPDQSSEYNPIRAGICSVMQLELIDAFGQTRTWTYEPVDTNTSIAETLPHQVPLSTDSAPSFFLPPRYAQPARLETHWIAADGSNAWESAHVPEASPICGWITLNRVNAQIMVYEADGTLLGSIPEGGGALSYQPGKSASDLTDPWLAQVVAQLEAQQNSAFSQFNLALLTIEPSSMVNLSPSVILESRPLAIARVALSLELKGVPAPHQSYDTLGVLNINDDAPPQMTSEPAPFVARETCGFENVVVPVRLGDVTMAADGLVAYWPISGSDISPSYTLVSDPDEAANGVAPTLPLTADPQAAATTVLMLFDPTAPIHVSPTVLPVKQLTLPPDMVAAATANMELLLGFDHVLTPAAGLTMPLPSEIKGTWAWTYDDNGNWAEDQTPTTSDNQWQATGTPAVIRSGYLRTGEDNA